MRWSFQFNGPARAYDADSMVIAAVDHGAETRARDAAHDVAAIIAAYPADSTLLAVVAYQSDDPDALININVSARRCALLEVPHGQVPAQVVAQGAQGSVQDQGHGEDVRADGDAQVVRA